MPTIEDVAALASTLPQVSEGERYRHRSWLVAGKVFAWERPFSKADLRRFGDEEPPGGPILAVTVADLADKEAVLAQSSPAVFTIPHFNGFAAVLVHLAEVGEDELRELVVDAWLACAPDDLSAEMLRGSD